MQLWEENINATDQEINKYDTKERQIHRKSINNYLQKIKIEEQQHRNTKKAHSAFSFSKKVVRNPKKNVSSSEEISVQSLEVTEEEEEESKEKPEPRFVSFGRQLNKSSLFKRNKN